MAVAVPGVTLGERLGQGAFGQVYRGRHETLQVEVAVKLIDVRRLPPTEQVRVLEEAQLMARLDHPNLLWVFDAGMAGEQAYIVVELMDGGSCAGLTRLDSTAAQAITVQLTSGVQALHDARVLHRDIKPANCLRRARDQRIKLADLGLAVEVATHGAGAPEFAGTIPFMAPELFDTPPRFGSASDLYALGMTLASFVLADSPYPRGPLSTVLPWIQTGERPRIATARPDLPGPLAQLIQRMISPRAEDRPSDAGDALRSLGGAALAPTRDAGEAPGGTAMGAWLLGESVYDSSNWHGFAASHRRSGAAARLMHLKAGGPLSQETASILQSAERASRLSHPRIVPVLDWGTWEGRAYVVTAARGCTIHEVVQSRGPLDELTALGFAVCLAEGLAFLQTRGLVYQTLDPGAAVIAADARTAQLSWPIYCTPAGSLAQGRTLVPRFAAPEVLSGSAPTIELAVDLYGLGCVLFYMLSGEAPKHFASVQEIQARLGQAAPQTTAPVALLVAELLAPDPRTRPAATEAVTRMEEILSRLGARPGTDPTILLR
jgi:serine/threonine protein kinase